jgi:hypothetical protein
MNYWFFVSLGRAPVIYTAPELFSETFSLKSLTVVSKDSDILIYDCMRERSDLIIEKVTINWFASTTHQTLRKTER